MTEGAAAKVVDLRKLMPILRHRLAFQLVEVFEQGASFVLENDHHSNPLHDQLAAEYPKQLSWAPLE